MKPIILLLTAILTLLLSFNSIAQKTACQNFSISIETTIPTATLNNGVYEIYACPENSIYIKAIGNYSNNDISYHQNDTLVSFNWNDNIGTNFPTNNTFTIDNASSQVRLINLTATDTNNCISDNLIQIRIIITPSPVFYGSLQDTNDICIGDTTLLTANISAGNLNSPTFALYDTTYLPDGSGVTYSSSVHIFGNQNSSLQDTNLITFWAILEHSYMGDIQIKLSCPNGQYVSLKSYPGGSSTFLGEPIDNNSNQIPGVGYEYHWSAQGTETLLDTTTYTYSYVNLSGVSYTSHSYMPPSINYPSNSTATGSLPIVSYKPEDPMVNLIGCPINGNWTLDITDNMAIDNGFIFGWGINFGDSSVYNFQQIFNSQTWNNSDNIISNNGNTINVLLVDTGIYKFTNTVIDTFGCIFDTSIYAQALSLPKINLGNDTIICANMSIDLNSGPEAYSQLWSTNSTSATITIDSIEVGLNSTEISLQIIGDNGCQNNDTIIISFTDCTTINNAETKAKLMLYPNPSYGVFIITGQLNTDKNFQMQIYNSSAKIIVQKNIASANGFINRTIDLRGFAKGIYYLKLYNSEIDEMVKIIVE